MISIERQLEWFEISIHRFTIRYSQNAFTLVRSQLEGRGGFTFVRSHDRFTSRGSQTKLTKPLHKNRFTKRAHDKRDWKTATFLPQAGGLWLAMAVEVSNRNPRFPVFVSVQPDS